MPESTRQTWDAAADRFDDEPDHGLRDPDVRAAWLRLLMAELPAAPASVADMGCGTGSLSVLLAEQGFTVHGVDLSPRMVERAVRKAERHGVEVAFRVGDVSDPPMAAPVDVVIGRHILWALPDPAAALDRWIGLLAPGGTLILVEGRWHTGDGLVADELLPLVGSRTSAASVRHLPEPTFWGREISDERYLISARA